ncbi:MAG: matrixin family metalloprotease, partial [Betaproteobacteria bacterium]|nr:matrixin family metalloprotease [Betaproteobacteria bacterium]
MTVLEQPKYGVLKDLDEINRDMGPVYAYDVIEGTPNGTEDRAVFLVEIGGKRIKIVERFILTFNYESLKGCNGKDYYIRRISQVVDETSISPYELLQLSMAQGVDYRMASLQGTTLAETTGTGAESIITLDSDAAGHGWYIDYTPYLNEEFLPTSNPNEWVAKPGSEAEGKMDMLTVLLHEYGHALGLDHTADAHDFMAATLQPGVRRTLSIDQQLELMRLAGIFVTPESPSEPYAPTDPGAPLPFTRVVATRSARRAAGFDSLVPQFDTAANTKLANPEFAGGEGWSTTGDVRFENGTATLTEGTATQTRLNQVFVVNEGDRFLSFTVANAAIGDQANGPDDAFEVALLDANTGLSLLGGTGLTKSDAALNRQADGSEYKASGISAVANADGSRTYLVDLAGIAAGTVVNLSFDLIGFGKGLEAQN